MEQAAGTYPFFSSPLEALLCLSEEYEVFTILHSNDSGDTHGTVAAFGMQEEVKEHHNISLSDGKWKFGYIGYDLKNKLERLHSAHIDRIGAPELFFFVPQLVVEFKQGQVIIHARNREEEESIFKKLQAAVFAEGLHQKAVHLQQSLSREQYLDKILHIKDRIKQGDIYEMNFCMEFFATAELSPAHTYFELNAISQAPFSFYARYKEVFAMGSSPERFLQKKGPHIITQPIKGTAPRSTDANEDARLKESLHTNEKERNENVMIVDVSRNDLSRIAKRGTVKVDELFGVYSFRQVHQLISTVSCDVPDSTSFAEIVQATFPPASMTGAPKIRAMQIIEDTETFKRGIYSGALGYIAPNGDFDLNVVIRTILYNQRTQQVSYAAGSAITDKCVPEQEYEECLLKANAMRRVLEG